MAGRASWRSPSHSHAPVSLVDGANYNHKLMSDTAVSDPNTRTCVVSRIVCLTLNGGTTPELFRGRSSLKSCLTNAQRSPRLQKRICCRRPPFEMLQLGNYTRRPHIIITDPADPSRRTERPPTPLSSVWDGLAGRCGGGAFQLVDCSRRPQPFRPLRRR